MPVWMNRFRARMDALFNRSRYEQDLDDELRFHQELLEQESGDRIRAVRQFGNTTQIRERAREAALFGWLETLWRDVRFGVRSLRRTPVLSVVAIVSLALGISATTTMYSLVDTLLLHAVTARDADRVVTFGNISYPNARELERFQIFDDVGAYVPQDLDWREGDQVRGVFALSVTPSFFETLGVNAALGRTFRRDEATPGHRPRLVVIGYRFWQRRLNADPAAIGRVIKLNDEPYSIVGVLPRYYRSAMKTGISPELYVPFKDEPRMDDQRLSCAALARLRRGQTREQGRDALYAALAALKQKYPKENGRMVGTPRVEPIVGTAALQGVPEAQPLLRFSAVALGVAVLVLLIACANAGGLLLARGAARSRELGIRLSIGASRTRILQQLLIEAGLLATAGTACGFFLTYAVALGIGSLTLPLPVPIEFAFDADLRLLALTAGLALVSTVLCGLVPAFHGARTGLAGILAAAGAGRGASPRHRFRTALVTTQIAVSTVLVAGAMAFTYSALEIRATRPGFDVDHTLWVQLRTHAAGPELHARQSAMLDALREAPGVVSAAYCSYLPLGFESGGAEIRLASEHKKYEVGAQWVGPDYFRTMQIPLLWGREFRPQDLEPRPATAVIANQTFARKFFGGADPVGQRVVRIWRNQEQPLEVIGLAADTKLRSLGETPLPIVFLPESSFHYVVRAQGPALGLVQPLGRITHNSDANAAVMAKTVREQLAITYWPSTAAAVLVLSLGVVGVALALIGLYGVISYDVSRRTAEIGIRMALGADRWSVLGTIGRQGALVIASGAGIGLALVVAAGPVIDPALATGVSARNPLLLAGALALLAASGMLAGLPAALHATRIDPNAALRHE